MAKHACRCKKTEPEECPEWIFTFADLVMLMMGFFVILWVLKPAPNPNPGAPIDDKWLEVVAKIREAFGRLPDPESKDPVDMAILMKKIEQLELPLKNPGKGGETREIKQGAEGTDPLVMNVRPGTHVSVGGRLSFEPGDAKLSPETTRVLAEIARLIRGHRNITQVKGHTSLDDLPDTATPQQRMDLSIRRAQAAADYLVANGVSADIVRVQGCSTFEPVAQRTYDGARQSLNRRVEVEVTDSLVQERQDLRPPAAVPPMSSPAPSTPPPLTAPTSH